MLFMTKRNFFNILLLFLCLLLGCGSSFAAPETKKKQLVILNSYNEVAPWPRKYINAVIEEVSDRPDFNSVKVIHLNNILIFNQNDYDEMVSMLFDNYQGDKPDYLVMIGNFAFTLRDKIKEIWGDVPILLISQYGKYAPLEYYFTVNSNNDSILPPKMKPMEDLRNEYNFSMVLSPNAYKETVDMMISMFPDMKKFVFMADGLYSNHHTSYMIKEYIKLKYPNVEYEWLLAGEEGVMLPYLNNTDPNIGLLLSTWYYTAPGVSGHPMMSATDSYLINGAHRPVFGLRYAYTAYGILGGYYSSHEEIHSNVLDALKDLISGKDMREVPFRVPEHAYPYINYEKLIALGLDESICPKNTVFIDKPVSFWEQYKDYFYYGGAALIVILIGVVILIIFGKRPRSKKDYNALVNSMPIGYMQVILLLDKDGQVKKVIYCAHNKTLLNLAYDHNLKKLKADEFDNYWQETADSLAMDPEPKSLIVKAPDEDLYIEFMVSPNPKSKENKLILDIFAIDVTDKMQVENVLREAARTAVEADNMKSAFLANMSHEIRTPLNAIVGFSNLLCKTLDPEKRRRFVEIIETNNQLLLKLIGDILDISKADSGKMVFNMHTVDVNKLIKTVCSGIDMSSRPDVQLQVVNGLDQCYITTDSYRLTQVFNNLLTNAIKFTEKGFIKIGYDIQDDMIRFFVKDTGMGISEADIKKLFTRFTKLNSFIQGTGLGLSISKTIVEKLGGTIKVVSPGRGKGTTFYFTVPYVLKDEDAKDDVANESNDESRFEALKRARAGESEVSSDSLRNFGTVDASKPSYKYEKKKILIVEDNESNSALFDALLEDRFDLVHASDGEEAIRIFARETPDLVLMDINLPYKNGYEATEEIRRLAPTVPIIAVTAYAQQSDKEKILNSGFSSYLAKPIEEDQLIAQIRRYL